MPPILKVLKAYLVLAGFTVAGLVAWRIATAYRWERLGDEDGTMAPTLAASQAFRVDRTVALEDLRRGNLVAYIKDPLTPGAVSVGRVIGLPGDRVRIEKGEVRVNGELSSDGPSGKPTEGEVPEIVIPRGTLFLLGDLRSDMQRLCPGGSVDSRALGPVSAGRLLGRVVI